MGFVVVGRYEDCQWVLRDSRFGKGEMGPMWEGYGLTEAQWLERFPDFERRMTSMLGLDPPDHTRLRRLVAKAFTPKTVENLRPDIVRLTDELLDRFSGDVDVIRAGVAVAHGGHRRDAQDPPAGSHRAQPRFRITAASAGFNPLSSRWTSRPKASKVIAESSRKV
jgi:hypothetical protein